jgi:hypothetical protein
VFVEIVIESETYHIYNVILLTIKIAAHNTSGVSNSYFFPQHNTIKLDIVLLLYEMT